MKKILLFLLLSVFAIASPAWDQQPPLPITSCQQQAPYGFPQTTRQGVAICRHSYVTLNDTTAKLPIWVSYVLLPQHVLGCIPRSNAFSADASLPKGARAEVKDYAASGYDIGHQAPDGDMSWDQEVELESFILTNMAPQLPGLNRGIWKLLETSIRGWAYERGHAILVYDGPIYNSTDRTIGPDRVVVPHAFYKIVIDTATNEVAGFIFPQAGNLGNNLLQFRASIQQINQQTGIVFQFPQNAVELQPNQLWPVDFGALTRAKKATCGTVDN